MLKTGIIGLIGAAILGTQAMAIEDGSYNCIITAITNGEFTKKLPEKDYQSLSFTKQDQKIVDSQDTYTYTITTKGLDIYENKTLMIAMPSDNVGKEIFRFDFKTKGKKIIYLGYCEKK